MKLSLEGYWEPKHVTARLRIVQCDTGGASPQEQNLGKAF